MSGLALKPGNPGAGADIAGPPVWPGWELEDSLRRTYAKKVKTAFSDAITQASAMISNWWEGKDASTRQVLVHAVSDLVKRAIGEVLYLLWQEAFFLGDKSAEAVAAHKAADYGAWVPGRPESAEVTDLADHLRHLLDAYGVSIIRSIATTRMQELGEEISEAVAKGEQPEQLIARLPQILLADMRSDLIARTETMRGISSAAMARYKRMGVTHKSWALAPGDPCKLCQGNAADGPVPLDSLHKSGAFVPPGHPRCRCATIGHVPPNLMKQRRVDRYGRMLPNEASGDYHSEPGGSFSGGDVQQPPNPSGPGYGGGGQSLRPHDASGTQYEDIPGSSAGLEPPRWGWDYGTAGPGGAFAYGDLNRPAGNQDLWPQGGHGTEQPPDDWSNLHNPAYPERYARRPATDLDDESDPDERDEEEPEDEDDADFPYRRGRAPNAVGKQYLTDLVKEKYKPWKDDSIPVAERVHRQLADGYPARAISWVKGGSVDWHDPTEVNTKDIDFSAEDSWRASDQPDKVEEKKDSLEEKHKDGKHGKPVVMIKSPGNDKHVVVDGHHRVLAARDLKLPVWAYIGHVTHNKGPWLRTHQQQEVDKAVSLGCIAAGIAVRAKDSGRILMIQRALPAGQRVNKAAGESACDPTLSNPVASEHIYNLMRENYKPKGIKWVRQAVWHGPVLVAYQDLDFNDEKHWAAVHQHQHVKEMMRAIKRKEVNPIILVHVHGEDKFRVVDGHHRSEAFKQLNRPVIAYVGVVPPGENGWQETHLYQIHQGDDPKNK